MARTLSRAVVALLLAALALVLCTTREAAAATASAAWSIESFAYPRDFSSADTPACLAAEAPANEARCDTYLVNVTDSSGVALKSTPVTITDRLPAGVTVQGFALLWSGPGAYKERSEAEDLAPGNCKAEAVSGSETVICTLKPTVFSGHPVQPDDTLKLWVSVTIDEPEALGHLLNRASVVGGGAPEVSTESGNTVGMGRPAFGLSGFASPFLDASGSADSGAGEHPYELNVVLNLNTAVREDPEGQTKATSIQDPRDVIVDLPPGVVGSALAAPRCTMAELSSKGETNEQGFSGCSPAAIIGHIRTLPTGNISANAPIYNMVPEHGVAAELGFIDATGGTHVLDVGVAPTAQGYVLRTTAREVPQLAISEIITHVYGDPAARCHEREEQESRPGVCVGYSEPQTAMLTNPSYCSGEPLATTVHMDSWQAPGSYGLDGSPDFADPNWVSNTFESPATTGCDQLSGLFKPTISAEPDTVRADSPTGLEFGLDVPQQEGVEAPATPPLRNTTVTLPEGLTVNPSAANGLEACSLAQIGMSSSGVPDAAPPRCPDASRIGTVEVETPALPGVLTGSVYVAKQGENPFGSLLAGYIAIDDLTTGVVAKIPAEIKPSSATGQVTANVRNSPQLPFSHLRIHLFGGKTAPLETPSTCGAYSVTSELTPWSAPQSGAPATPVSPPFSISESATGEACQSPPPFGPQLTAGTANPQAGAYSPLSVTISRQDNETRLQSVAVTTAPGLLGTIKGVTQCGEPAAAQGNCPASSLLGEADAAAGAGPAPYWVHGGQVFLTGPYNGGPFGLSILVPTTAGPFTLSGNAGFGREVVRSSIRVNPVTAQITVVSDPLPTILEGIPLDVRSIVVNVDRPNFIFNATDCSQLAISAAIASTSGANATSTAPYHAADCSTLPFKPVLTASTKGPTSRLNGASLVIKVTAKPGEANVAKTDLQIPRTLPARLPTLNKACLAAVFEANPASCPSGSNIGMAVVHTPLLNSALSGPIYLVSHGNAAFPDSEIVLQGEGVTTILDGKTNIKKGVTYSNFETVPDVPFTSFEASLPEGPHSIFGNGVNTTTLCGYKLSMPTTIAGQNGAKLTQSTALQVTGCPNKVSVRTHSLARHVLKIVVYVPSEGGVVVSGSGLHQVRRSSHGQELLTLELRTKAGKRRSGHVHIAFMPRRGRRQVTQLTTSL